jgi:outer membrane protein assembly factor BamB
MRNTMSWEKCLSFFFIVVLINGTLAIVAAGPVVPYGTTPQTMNVPGGNDWWPMFRHDVVHSGFSTSTDPVDGQVLWSYQTQYFISSSPAVSHGRVYVGSWDRNVYCFAMDTGALLWNYSTGDEVTSSPAVSDGKVYVCSQDSKLYCLDAVHGTLIWSFKTGYLAESSPTVTDGRVYFGSSDGCLYCLNAEDGTLLWAYQTGNVVLSSPAVVNSRVYFGISNGAFLCLDAITGGVVWSRPMQEGTISSPAVDAGKVYFGSNDLNVYCLDASDGSLIWNYTALSEVHSSPAIAYGNLYVGTNLEGILCLNKDTGAFVWSRQVNTGMEASPAVADGKVYFGADPCCGFSEIFYCLDAFGGAVLWTYDFNTLFHMKSSAAVAAGKVFVGSGDGRVFAFGDVEFLADANGPYHAIVNNSVDFTGSVYGGQPGYSWYWEFGDSTTSTEQSPIHTYAATGTYTVTLSVTDGSGNVVTDETQAVVETPNEPPEAPAVDGPSTGVQTHSYEYSFVTSDPNNDIIFYSIDWGDGTYSGWLGPVPSGVTLHQNHSWAREGSYTMHVKAKDSHGAVSEWSSFMTTMKPLIDIEIRGGVGIVALLKNNDDVPATNVSWSVMLNGSFVNPTSKTGVIPSIPAGGRVRIRCVVLGLGLTEVIVLAISHGVVGNIRVAHVSLFLFLAKVKWTQEHYG